MIRKAIIAVLTLAALGTLAGGIASMWVPIRWTSRQHPRFPHPILSLGYTPRHHYSSWLGRPQIIHYYDAPVGGPNHAEQFWFVAGVWINTGKWNCGVRYYDVHFPLWMPFVLFAAYPTIAFIRSPARRQRQRRKLGLCVKCGYDLTGNVTGVCSECGTKLDDG